jgi:hypothetical protein
MEVHGIINTNEYRCIRNIGKQTDNSDVHLNDVLDCILPLLLSLEFTFKTNRNLKACGNKNRCVAT